MNIKPSLAEQFRLFELRRQAKRERQLEKREEAKLRRQAEKVCREAEALRLAHIRRVAAYRHELYEEKRRAREREDLMRELDSMSVEEFYQSLRSPAVLAAGRQIVRARSRLRLRYRRMAKEKGRPPLRQLPCRKPTWGEICANAVSALWDMGRPNRNLLKVVRRLCLDPSPDLKNLPENIIKKHRPAACALVNRIEREMTPRFRADSISCRRTLRRGRILAQHKNYRWTRFPAAGLDNARKMSAAMSVNVSGATVIDAG